MVRPARDAVTTIASPSSISRASRRTPYPAPGTLTAITRRYSSPVSSVIDGVLVAIPALRHASSTRSTDCHAVGSVTSKPVTRSSSRTCAPSSCSRSTIACPIPPAEPVTMAVLGNKDDLPGVLTLLDQLVRVRCLLQGEARADQRLHGARRPELQQLADRVSNQRRLVPHEAAEVEPMQREVAPDQRRRVELLPPPTGE